MVDQEEFLIQELADKAGVSHRTIRYYTQEGLLPEPINRGKYAYYTQEHLDRLRLILQLKDTYLPLKEIRQLLVALSWPEVRDLLQKGGGTRQIADASQPVETRPSVSEASSALDYIQRLLNPTPQPGTPSPSQTAMSRPSSLPNPVIPGPVAPPESWRRFTLSPGVELHVKEPATSGDRQRIDQLIQFARMLFSKDQK